MNKKKVGILVLVILLAVGFAAVSTNLIINGTAIFGTNDDDFDVIFTNSIIDGVDVSESTISEDGKTLTFETSELAIKDEESVLDFTIKNNSSQYDANVTMECIAEGENASEYYEISNTIPNVIEAKTSKDGKVTARLKKASVNEISETFTCTISATAVERESIGDDGGENLQIISCDETSICTDQDGNGIASTGDVVTIGEEKFNIISTSDDTVTMLAVYNLGTDYRQSETTNYVAFSVKNGWEYSPGPKEIDIETWSTNSRIYVNNYVTYLKRLTGDTNISGNLITLSELKELGCTINDDYSWTSGLTCANSSNVSWLVNGQYWWTRSSSPDDTNYVWRVHSSGDLHNYHSNANGIRPVITISKTLLEN